MTVLEAHIAGIAILFLLFVSLHALYKSVMKREDSYHDGFFLESTRYQEEAEWDDYLTDKDWEAEQAELDRFDRNNPEF